MRMLRNTAQPIMKTINHYRDPDNWPINLVDRIENAYGAMQSSLNYWVGRFQPDSYSRSMLCKRCRDLIVNAVAKEFGPDNAPIILQFEDHVGEMRAYSFLKRDELKEKMLVSPKFKATDRDRLSAESLIVSEYALQFIQKKQLQAKERDSMLTETQKSIITLIRENPPIKLVSIASKIGKDKGHVSRIINDNLIRTHKYDIRRGGHLSGDPGYWFPSNLD